MLFKMTEKSMLKVILLLIFGVAAIMYFINMATMIKSVGKESVTNNITNDSFKKELKQRKNMRIIIDAGHGGNDPGKVGVNGALEKDINLEIAKKLQECLIEKGFLITMTRLDDNGLYEDSHTNKKMSELKKRIEIINESDAILVVSIHQNSYGTSDVKGAQVFYYKDSDISKNAASHIQKAIKKYVDSENNRVEKSNDSYYLLKKSNKPIVIAECGFLSNYGEADLLVDEDYQKKIVQGIANGVIEWANSYLEE